MDPCPHCGGPLPTQNLAKEAQQQTGLLSHYPVLRNALPEVFDDSKAGPGVTVNALVYIKYVDRIEKAIIDGRKLGLSAPFLSQVEQCIHARQLRSHGRSIPIQQEAIIRATDQHPRMVGIKRAKDKHPNMVKTCSTRYVVTKSDDGDRPRKRRNSSPL